MTHRIQFQNWSDMLPLMTQEQARDLVELYYRWPSTTFILKGDLRKKNTRGLHQKMAGSHVICLSRSVIEDSFCKKQRCGGNGVAPTVKMAAAMVLVHEIQHANQSMQHSGSSVFFNQKRYISRPCEKDARAFVDAKLEEIANFCGEKLASISSFSRSEKPNILPEEEIEDIIETLCEFDNPTVNDVREQLRASGLNNISNFRTVVSNLREMGFKI